MDVMRNTQPFEAPKTTWCSHMICCLWVYVNIISCCLKLNRHFSVFLSKRYIENKKNKKKQKQKQASMIAPIPHEFFRVSIDSAKHWTITTVWRHTLVEFRWRWWRLFVKSWFVVCYHHSHITHRHRHRFCAASVNLGSRPRKGSPKK